MEQTDLDSVRRSDESDFVMLSSGHSAAGRMAEGKATEQTNLMWYWYWYHCLWIRKRHAFLPEHVRWRIDTDDFVVRHSLSADPERIQVGLRLHLKDKLSKV